MTLSSKYPEMGVTDKHYAGLFRFFPDSVTLTRASDGILLDINEQFERLSGYLRTEMVGMKTAQLGCWPDPDQWEEVCRVLDAGGEIRDFETRIRCKDGILISVLMTLRLLEIEGEQCYLTVAHIISGQKQLKNSAGQRAKFPVQRKLAEEALKSSEAEKYLLLNSTIDLVVYHDANMKIVWGNRRALDSVGMQQEELMGKRCWEVWHRRNEPCDGCPVVLAMDTGKPQEREIRSFDGREWYIRGFPVKDDEGIVKGVVEFCLEITDRKRAEYALLESERLLESEKRFRSLFEHMLDGVAYCRMLYDHNGCPADFVYLDVNRAFSELTGLHDVVGRKVSEVLPGIRESSPELFEVYGRVAATGQPERCELYIQQLSLWRSMSVYSTEKGHFVAVFENINERKRIEAELRESNLKLQELTEHLTMSRELKRKALARKVHDELGTCMTLLKFDLAWLKRNHPSDDKAVVERLISMDALIHECTGSIQRLTSELRPSLLDEQGIAAAIEWQTIEFEKRSGISCTVETAPAIPPLSQDKSINVYRIFQESMSNIMRHSGATCVRISLSRTDQQLVLLITDNGAGISEQQKSAHTSFGILGMVERARLCGGEFIIKGIPGKGTTISLSVPI